MSAMSFSFPPALGVDVADEGLSAGHLAVPDLGDPARVTPIVSARSAWVKPTRRDHGRAVGLPARRAAQAPGRASSSPPALALHASWSRQSRSAASSSTSNSKTHWPHLPVERPDPARASGQRPIAPPGRGTSQHPPTEPSAGPAEPTPSCPSFAGTSKRTSTGRLLGAKPQHSHRRHIVHASSPVGPDFIRLHAADAVAPPRRSLHRADLEPRDGLACGSR